MMRCDLPSPAHASGRVEKRTEDRYHTLREGSSVSSDQEPCRISTRNGLDSRSASFQTALHPSNHGRSPQLNTLRPTNEGWNTLAHTSRDIVLYAFDLLPSYVDQVDFVSSVDLPRPPDPRRLSKRGPSNRPVKLHRWPSPLPRHQNGAPKLTTRPLAGAWPNVTYRPVFEFVSSRW